MFGKRKQSKISNDTPLEVGHLTVYPDRFSFKEVRCSFFDIEHIEWYWKSETINVINTQEAMMALHIRGREQPIFIKKSTMYVTPKIVTAYTFIAKHTFQSRLAFYTQQLEKVGGFTYDNCHFYTDGRVIYNGKTFNLANANTEPFDITIKQGGLFSAKVKISLLKDRDVILTLIDFILQNPQDPAHFVKAHQQQTKQSHSTAFVRDIVSMMAKLSGADGRVSPEEVQIVKGFLQDTMELDKHAMAEAIGIFNDAKSSPSAFENYAESLASGFNNDEKVLIGVLDLLFSIAIADGVLSAEEELLLLEAEAIFGLEGPAFQQFRSESTASQQSKEQYFLTILGLSQDATKDEIKLQYKRLVMKFHPDRVNHLGDEFVLQAEIRMKEINLAYEYLSK